MDYGLWIMDYGQGLRSKLNYFDMLFRVFAPLNPPTGGT